MITLEFDTTQELYDDFMNTAKDTIYENDFQRLINLAMDYLVKQKTRKTCAACFEDDDTEIILKRIEEELSD